MAIECWVSVGWWWLGPKWVKHFGEAHPSIQWHEVSILHIPIVEEAATNALMEEILEPN